jgi:hypothetical protein
MRKLLFFIILITLACFVYGQAGQELGAKSEVSQNDLTNDITADQARHVGENTPLITNYCEILTTGDQYYFGSGWFTGQETYAVYQDPASCGTYPFGVGSISWALRLTPTGTGQYVYYQCLIMRADLTVPSCPIPDNSTIYYTGPLDSIWFDPGDFLWVTNSIAAVVNAPYFIAVYFPNTQSDMQLPLEQTSSGNCKTYNDWGTGWVDMNLEAWNLNISNLWRSGGLQSGEYAIFKAHFMTPGKSDYPYDVTISDDDYRQDFHNVTYIETVVPDTATYTYKYTYGNDSSLHSEMGQMRLCFSPGEIREFDFYAIDPAQVEECSRPYVIFREIGANDSLTWQWFPEENRLEGSVHTDSGKYIGIGIWVDADTIKPIDMAVVTATIEANGPPGPYPTSDVTIIEATYDHPYSKTYSSDISWNAPDSILFVIIDDIVHNMGVVGTRGGSHNGAIIDSFTTVLQRPNGTVINPQYVYPQYSVAPPLGNLILKIESLPAEFVSIKIPLDISVEDPAFVDFYPPKLAELQPYSFLNVAEGFYGIGSFSNLVNYEGDSISVDVAAQIPVTWWGCFVLPDSFRVVQATVFDTVGFGNDVIYLVDHAGDYNLVTLRITPDVVRLVLKYRQGGGCEYVPGDANNSHTFTGLDVTYAVRFFKGGPFPPYSCDCPPHGTWYVSGDVNGSCSFTGLDITYSVRYFKGGPAPIPCSDCPPAAR